MFQGYTNHLLAFANKETLLRMQAVEELRFCKPCIRSQLRKVESVYVDYFQGYEVIRLWG